MTIVHLNIGLGGGGAEHMILEMAKRSHNDGINTIVCGITDNDQIEYKFKDAHIEFHYLGVNSFSKFFKGLSALKKILRSHQDIVLHCHMFHALIIGVFYRLFVRKVPIVFTLHNILVEEVYRRFILFFTKPFRQADINFSKSGSKWYLKPIHVISNGVDFDSFKLLNERNISDETPFEFLFLGRIEEQKNPLIIPDLALKLIDKGYNDFIINIAGNGDMRSDLETLIKKNKLENHIKILGFQKDVKALLNKAHCMIMPSLWEGLPISLIEASANKLPIITTPVGSIPDFFNDSNAYLVDCDSFHIAMISVMNDYEKAKKKANKLFEDNKAEFDIDSVYKKHIELYKSVS